MGNQVNLTLLSEVGLVFAVDIAQANRWQPLDALIVLESDG